MNLSPFNPFLTNPRRHVPGLRAFTLVELLVVVGVIGVLAALIVPAISRSMRSAKTIQCASNLRQIGAGLFNYARDNDGQLPQGSSWDKDIARYLNIPVNAAGQPTQNSKIFQCPEDPKPNGDVQRSYTCSRRSAEGVGNAKGVFGRTADQLSLRLAAMEYPSFTIMIVEKYHADNQQFKGNHAQTDGWLGDLGQTHFDNDINKPYYHGSGANYLFCDGHVECLDVPKILQNQSIKGWVSGRWATGPKE